MKVLLVNGSPHKEGCTYTALTEIADTLQKEGIETEIFWIGPKPLGGCIACGGCKTKGECVFNDAVCEVTRKAADFDGFIFGTPVHFAGAAGSMTGFMDRLFYSDLCAHKDNFYLKPAACVVSARRAGNTATFDQLNKYFTMMEMPIISSHYWNMVHGNKPEQVKQDEEGMQTMRSLARNMAWFLKCKEAGAKAGIPMPEREDTIRTNFIR